MAKTKGTSRRDIKIPSYWKIGILFPDGKKIIKPRCTLDEIFETYFIGLEKYLSSVDETSKLLDLYKKTFESKNIKVSIQYVDSWGHLWKGKVAWPKDEWFINYLNKRLYGNN